MSNQLLAALGSESTREKLAMAIPSHMDVTRQIRIATQMLNRVPMLAQCDPASFLGCLAECTSIGLEPDGRRAHLIPFRNNKKGIVECTLIIDYKGLVELILRSGDVSNIHADIVCENDEFEENLGQIVTHRIDRRKPRGEMYAVYSRVTMKDGSVSCSVMGKDEVDSIRKRSKSGNAGPWVTDYNEMAKKTVVRRHSKLLPISSEVHRANEIDGDRLDKPVSMRNATPEPAKIESIGQPESPIAERPATPAPNEAAEADFDLENAPDLMAEGGAK